MTMSLEDLRQDEYVLNSPISKERVARFYSDYLDSRRQSGAAEAVFEQADSLSRRPDWNDEYGIGFNVIIRKGPFVDGSNWAEYRTWEFALAVERHLLSKFDELLRDNAQPLQARPAERKWSSMFTAADELLFKLNADASKACIVVTGPLHDNWLLDLTRQPEVIPDWDLPRDLNRTWIHGKYRGAVILHIAESTESSLFVVDVPRFARLIQHGTPQFHVDEIDEKRAQEILSKLPDQSAGPDPVRAMRLKVWMRLYESWSFDLLDERAAAHAALAPLGEGDASSREGSTS